MVGELTQAFRRLDQRYGGSGLGLNIVIRIVQLHQGRLTLENRRDARGLTPSAGCRKSAQITRAQRC